MTHFGNIGWRRGWLGRLGRLGRLGAWLGASAPAAAAVEFAILVPVLIVGIVGVANLAFAVYEEMELTAAARAGAQMAIRDREAISTIKDAVVDSTNLSITTADVTTTESGWCADVDAADTCGNLCADGDPAQCFMTVTATKTFTPLIIGSTLGTILSPTTLSGSVRVRTK